MVHIHSFHAYAYPLSHMLLSRVITLTTIPLRRLCYAQFLLHDGILIFYVQYVRVHSIIDRMEYHVQCVRLNVTSGETCCLEERR
jgi:hypothetical protein